MDTGERIMIEYAWQTMLNRQQEEREALRAALRAKQEKEREAFYRSTKAHWDTRPAPTK